MDGLKQLGKSKRFWVAAFGFAGLVASVLGYELPPVLVDAALNLILAVIAGYTLQDTAAAFKSGGSKYDYRKI